jgi:capsular exopolysaccharide synthesis family protein
MVPSNVTIIDPARLPTFPFKPDKTRNMALAMFLGLTLGVGLAFMLEYLDDSIKTIDDLERACHLPSLGVLPLQGENGRKGLGRNGYLPLNQSGGQDPEKAKSMDLLVYQNPKSPISEAIHHVYSSLMLSTSGKPPCTIMITSPNPRDGKTMLVSNLALSCAQNGLKVLVVDCDLRKPRMHKIFQVEAIPGLTNYLTGKATLEEVLQPTLIPNLTIIPAGAQPPNPANLLNSEMYKELLLELRQRFDHVIIDTPPVLGFADARFVSLLVDGVLLLTKYQSTRKSAGRMAYQLLSQAPLLGVILNSAGKYGESYGYGGYYHYKYYSHYYEEDKSS